MTKEERLEKQKQRLIEMKVPGKTCMSRALVLVS